MAPRVSQPRPKDLAALSAQRLHDRLNAMVARLGFAEPGSIPEGMTFRQWCEDLARRGLKVDNRPFRLDDRPALVPIYDAIPTTRAEAFERRLIIQKATQLGLTVWEVLADIYMAIKWGPVNIGLFLPDQTTAAFKSEHRFMPIVRSSPELRHAMTHRKDPDGSLVRVGEGNVLTRHCLASLLLFLWTSGKVTTESRPMDIVSLDEVQGMTLAQIDKVLARMGDSDVQFALMLSTAFMPEADINFWYMQGTQEVWHTECPTCGAESDLSDPAGIFPDLSIGYNTGQFRPVGGREPPVNEYIWTCPHCRGWIPDPQRGRYIAQNPGANPRIRSFLLPRTISPRMTPRAMIEGFRTAKTGDQKMSFYNRTLARPYIDADQLPVTMAHCEAAAAEGKRLGLTWETKAVPGQGPYYMGLDQMGGWVAAIVKRRLPDGRQAVVHCEAIFDDDPFARCTELMRDFRISVCVLEQLPNVNDARRFTNKPEHRGRVFLCTGFSADPKADMITWGDAATRSDRRTAEEDRSRYAVTVSQYKAMQTALYRVRNLHCLFPSDTLEQDVVEDGKPKRINLVRDWVWLHFTKTALVITQDEKERKPKAQVHKVGIDPHFAFANMLCDIAWAREQGAGMVMLPDGLATPGQPETDRAKRVAEAMPGLPPAVVNMIEELPPGQVCGRCSAFQEGRCTVRGLRVAAKDPGCDLFGAAG